jgi:hypothetical protein
MLLDKICVMRENHRTRIVQIVRIFTDLNKFFVRVDLFDPCDLCSILVAGEDNALCFTRYLSALLPDREPGDAILQR